MLPVTIKLKHNVKKGVRLKCRFQQDLRGAISQKTAFFVVWYKFRDISEELTTPIIKVQEYTEQRK
jgi:hypothetical protein